MEDVPDIDVELEFVTDEVLEKEMINILREKRVVHVRELLLELRRRGLPSCSEFKKTRCRPLRILYKLIERNIVVEIAPSIVCLVDQIGEVDPREFVEIYRRLGYRRARPMTRNYIFDVDITKKGSILVRRHRRHSA